MRIFVCVKQVPASGETRLDPVTHTIIREGAEAILNPFDAFAVEEAVRLRARYGGSVTALSMGIPAAEAMLRRVIAVGADDAVLLTDRAFAGSDTLATARLDVDIPITRDMILFFLTRLRELDPEDPAARRRLIETFVNSIYLWNDKITMTFNYSGDTRRVTLQDIESGLVSFSDEDLTGSYASLFSSPNTWPPPSGGGHVFYRRPDEPRTHLSSLGGSAHRAGADGDIARRAGRAVSRRVRGSNPRLRHQIQEPP